MTFPFWHTIVNFDLLDLDLLDCSKFVEGDCSIKQEEEEEEGGVPKEVPIRGPLRVPLRIPGVPLDVPLGLPVGEPFLAFFYNFLLRLYFFPPS